MAAPLAYGSFLLFARSEPLTGKEGYLVAEQQARARWSRLFVPLPPEAPVRGTDPADPPRDFPWDVGLCVRLAVEIAESTHVPLRIIDLAHPDNDPELAARWIHESTVLPLLVSPTGRSMEGPDRFVPKELRRFYAAG